MNELYARLDQWRRSKQAMRLIALAACLAYLLLIHFYSDYLLQFTVGRELLLFLIFTPFLTLWFLTPAATLAWDKFKRAIYSLMIALLLLNFYSFETMYDKKHIAFLDYNMLQLALLLHGNLIPHIIEAHPVENSSDQYVVCTGFREGLLGGGGSGKGYIFRKRYGCWIMMPGRASWKLFDP